MKEIFKRKTTMLIALAAVTVMLLSFVSGANSVKAAEENVERYTIFGSLEGYDVVVSGEHVYDGQTLGVGTRFSTSENCRITKIRKYFGKEEHGTFAAVIWNGETGEEIKSYEWTIETGNDGWEELVLSEPIEIEAESEYVVEIENTKESPYYVYVRGYFEDNEIGFFDISGGNSVFTEAVGNMPLNVMGGNANFLVDVEVEYSKPVPTSAPEPTEEPTEEPTDKPADEPTAVPATEIPEASVPAATENGSGTSGNDQRGGNTLPIIIAAVSDVIIVASVVAIVVMKKKKGK